MTQLIKEQSRLAYLNSDFKGTQGVFFSKDQKMLSLEKQNEALKSELDRQMRSYNELIRANQQQQSKLKLLRNQFSLLQVQQQMMLQSVQKLQKRIKENEPIIKRLTDEVEQISERNSLTRQQLEELLKKVRENDKIIMRFKQQVKTQKLMLKCEKNITKISQTFKKSYENYQKNIQILEYKLEGKKKYLIILTKKAQKQSKKQQEEDQALKKKKVTTANQSYSKSILSSVKKNPLNSQKQEAGQAKSNMKGYNDLIRRKNAILAQRK